MSVSTAVPQGALRSGSDGVGGTVTHLLPAGIHLGRTSIESVRRLSSQVGAVDDLLASGLPRGRISEMTGLPSSGKTSLLVAFLAAATQRCEATAYVDPSDSLDPRSFAAGGVELERLLWVRPPSWKDAARCAEIILQAGGFSAVVLDLDDRSSASGDRALPTAYRPPNSWRSPVTEDRSRFVLHLNVWPRLFRAAEQSQAALVVLAPLRCSGSVAALGIEMRARPLWHRGLWVLFEGFDTSVMVTRNKLGAPGRRVSVVARRVPLVDRESISL